MKNILKLQFWINVILCAIGFWIGVIAYSAFKGKTSSNAQSEVVYHTNTIMVPVERSELDLTISNATDHAVNVYLPGKPDKWGMRGSQDRYIDWPYPPLRTNLTQYEIIPGHGTAFIYFCNDGQLRWSFKPVKP